MFGESKKHDSQNISRCREVDRFCNHTTAKKREILKSFHRAANILHYTQDKIAKMAFIPPPNLTAEVVGKLLGLRLFTLLIPSDLPNCSLLLVPPPSGEAAIHKLQRKCPRAKGLVEDDGVVIPPPPTGMDNLIAQNDRAKQKKFKPSSGKAGDAQALIPPTTVSPSTLRSTSSLSKHKVYVEEPKSTSSSKHAEKFSRRNSEL